MKCRGIRGATTVDANSREDILAATKGLLQQMVSANGVEAEDVACILFTTTLDLDAEFPAAAARELGFSQTPLLCGHEMNVPGSLPMCVRILMLFNTEKSAEQIIHVYTKGAQGLRSINSDKKGSLEG